MKYRIAGPEDLKQITECIASTEYYHHDVDAAGLDGTIIVAEDDGVIVGCIWAMTCGRHAFVDYLAVYPKYAGSGLGVRLAYKMYMYLKRKGIRYVKSQIHGDNKLMQKIMIRLGSVLDAPYVITHTYLGD